MHKNKFSFILRTFFHKYMERMIFLKNLKNILITDENNLVEPSK